MSKAFVLPDLGEGLPDAIIREWYVSEGDTVALDQPMVAMETAKALVDVPAPKQAVIKKLHGKVGDTILTGEPLVTFESASDTQQEQSTHATVVGTVHDESRRAPQTQTCAGADQIPFTAEAWSLVHRYQIDDAELGSQFAHSSIISAQDIQNHINKNNLTPRHYRSMLKKPNSSLIDAQPMKGVRAAMAHTMKQSHEQVAAVTLIDDANIDAWDVTQDFTVRIIQAVCDAIRVVPILNSHFDAQHMALKTFDDMHIGIAMDTDHGLFVPVIHQAQTRSSTELRQAINTLKHDAQTHTLKPEQLKNPTISISNFGSLGAQYATPMIVPPMVAIVGIGQAKHKVIADTQKNCIVANMLPLSLTVDHCAITGGEATRFLAAMVASLEKKAIA